MVLPSFRTSTAAPGESAPASGAKIESTARGSAARAMQTQAISDAIRILISVGRIASSPTDFNLQARQAVEGGWRRRRTPALISCIPMSQPSYAKGPETPLVEWTLAEALQRTAERYPDGEALVSRHQNLRYTWQEFDGAVTRVARGLAG